MQPMLGFEEQGVAHLSVVPKLILHATTTRWGKKFESIVPKPVPYAGVQLVWLRTAPILRALPVRSRPQPRASTTGLWAVAIPRDTPASFSSYCHRVSRSQLARLQTISTVNTVYSGVKATTPARTQPAKACVPTIRTQWL